MFVLATQPQTGGEVIKDAFKLSCRVFRRCMPFVLLISLVFQTPLMFGVGSQSHDHLHGADIFAVLLTFFGSAFFFPALLHWIRALITDKSAPLKPSISLAINKFFTVLFAMLIVSFVTVLGAILVIPGIALFIFLLFYIPSIIFDDATIFSSIGNSWRLVRGSWWQTFFLFALTIFANYFFVTLTVGIFLSMGAVFENLMRWLLSAPLTLFLMALLIVQFNNLKLRAPLREEAKRQKKSKE